MRKISCMALLSCWVLLFQTLQTPRLAHATPPELPPSPGPVTITVNFKNPQTGISKFKCELLVSAKSNISQFELNFYVPNGIVLNQDRLVYKGSLKSGKKKFWHVSGTITDKYDPEVMDVPHRSSSPLNYLHPNEEVVVWAQGNRIVVRQRCTNP